MPETPERETTADRMPVWIGHPAVLVLYCLLLVSVGWSLIGAVTDYTGWFKVAYRAISLLLFAWIFSLSISVWRRRRRAR